MAEVVDPELADVAASWASQIDDEAAMLRRRAERVRESRRREDLLRLTEALQVIARSLRATAGGRSGPVGDLALDPAIEPLREEKLRAIAVAWSFRLRGVAEDAQALADEMEQAAALLDAISNGDPDRIGKLLLDRPAMA